MIILLGANIREFSIVGARAVVTKDVAPYTIAGGVPAKMIKKLEVKEAVSQLLLAPKINFFSGLKPYHPFFFARFWIVGQPLKVKG